MFSQDGLETHLQGMFGSGIMTAPTAANRALTRALHEDPDGHRMIIKGIDHIAELKERRALAKSKEAKKVYEILKMKGFSRSEFIFKDGEPHLLEMNTVPGLTRESILPQQAAAAGISLSDLFDNAIQEALK
jgi:hypothetical protein